MAGTKMFVFDPQDLLRLCTHYWDGAVPLDAEVKSMGVSPVLQRCIGIEAQSDEWETDTPLVMRYEGKKVLSWAKGDEQEPTWVGANETPARQ